MGLAQYAVIAVDDRWGVLHDGSVEGDFATKESAFESAIAAASLTIRQGHEIRVSVPGRDAGNGTALGAKEGTG
jgi:phosphotransferase system HPr-like phosphotransfer protein